MNSLCIFCGQETNYTETIVISLVASVVFALISFLLRLLYDYLNLSIHESTYHRMYKRSNPNFQDKIAAIAVVKYKGKGTLTINVTTLIHEDNGDPLNDYIFKNESIQEWEGIITMENQEAGKLYFYYLRPEEQKNELRSEFKRVLFLHNSKYLKLFGDGKDYGNEIFNRI